MTWHMWDALLCHRLGQLLLLLWGLGTGSWGETVTLLVLARVTELQGRG